MKKKYLIIGNGAAAVAAVKAIRKLDLNNEIVIITKEKHNAYSPPLITHYLAGEISFERMFICNDRFYKQYSVKVYFDESVIEIDMLNRKIITDKGRYFYFDKLLIASGATPKVNFGYGDTEGVLTPKTVDDALLIHKKSKNSKKVVFLGAGLVCMQTASSLYWKGKKILFVVGSKQVLSRLLDRTAAKMLQRRMESLGIDFYFGTKVEELTETSSGVCLKLNSGDKICADMVIVGKGVKPNISFLSKTGITINRGIIVNSRMQTNIENVFAAGDVAEGKYFFNEITSIFPNCSFPTFPGHFLLD